MRDLYPWRSTRGPNGKPMKITAADREVLAEEFERRQQEDPNLTVAAFARSVCGRYSVTAGYIRNIFVEIQRR